MLVCSLRRGGLALLGRRLGVPLSDGAAAALTTSAPPDSPKAKKRDPADDFIFKEKCKGTRRVSKNAEEMNQRLRRTNFGAPRKDRTGALGAVAPSATDVDRTAQPQAGSLHTAAASWAAQGGGSSAEDVAQELVEKERRRAGGAAPGQL
ncbi:hypothetical protein C2E21_5616 [Chlorella sorokiniana]|uniref:Uncharacterized protein n=1 Tax=Chlorella sorokiniana TaxID=3076 RepID=A0A2P6TNA4_CHLSO|nr:hypothetical protein C2E21_5616 [Chlorella sorokiniana]|eukprot:PRW50809.1 hypothetical protein C2E21_5616 [Chlorella sorokiniana]